MIELKKRILKLDEKTHKISQIQDTMMTIESSGKFPKIQQKEWEAKKRVEEIRRDFSMKTPIGLKFQKEFQDMSKIFPYLKVKDSVK